MGERGNWAARAWPERKASASISRWMPPLKAERASALEKRRPSAVLKPMNCMRVVGRSVSWTWPAAAVWSPVGSTVRSSICRVENRWTAVSRSFAWTRGMVDTGSVSPCHQSPLACR